MFNCKWTFSWAPIMSSNINIVIRKLEFLVGKKLGSDHYKSKVLRNQLPKWKSDPLRHERNWAKMESDSLRNERNWAIGKEEGEANLTTAASPLTSIIFNQNSPPQSKSQSKLNVEIQFIEPLRNRSLLLSKHHAINMHHHKINKSLKIW